MLLNVNLDLMIINEVEMVKSLITYIIYRLINMLWGDNVGFILHSGKLCSKLNQKQKFIENLY